jgi:hypothetical protein
VKQEVMLEASTHKWDGLTASNLDADAMIMVVMIYNLLYGICGEVKKKRILREEDP